MEEKGTLVDKRFGRLTVKEYLNSEEDLYLCICDCKKEITVKGEALLNKAIRNCGCFNRKNTEIKDVYKQFRSERSFRVWQYMLSRCYNPTHHAYVYYGAKGVTVCKEWLEDYTKFRDFLYLNGYDENAPFGKYTVDRIDNSKGYSPDNCRLVSMKVQSLNKTNNHRIEYQGRVMTVTEAAELNGLTNRQVLNRLDKGWDLMRALETPLTLIKTYEVNGETHTISEWARIMRVTDAVIRGRLRVQSMEKIYEEWKEKGRLEINDCAVKFEEVNGEKKNRSEWSKIIGINEITLRKLLKDHTMQEIYDNWQEHDGRLTLIRSNKLEEANGELRNRKEWSEILGISQRSLRNKLKSYSMQEVYDMYKNKLNTDCQI